MKLIRIKYILGIFINLYVLISISTAQSSSHKGEYDYSDEYSTEITIPIEGIVKLDIDKVKIPITLTNTGSKHWNSASETNPVFVSYHLFSKNKKKLIKFDNIRTPLGRIVRLGDSVDLDVILETLSKGEYVIQIDLVTEGQFWFKSADDTSIDISLKIEAAIDNMEKPKVVFDEVKTKIVWFIEGEKEINYCALLSESILEGNYKKFYFDNEEIYGVTAGSVYPQLWIRDASTAVPILRHLYKNNELVSWIIAHLSIQSDKGELQDWIMENNKTGKNTTESDQETSLIIAAYDVSKTIGYTWLNKKLNAKLILSRLEDALEFLFLHKLDKEHGLIKSGHTADWGDVSNEYFDERAVDLQPNSTEVVGIYTNSLVYSAITKLSYMFSRAGRNKKSYYWDVKGLEIFNNIQKHLWQQSQGFFLTHINLNSIPHTGFNENMIFPMGGNAIAIEAGVANSKQTQSIFKKAISLQNYYSQSTISGSLLPPYPNNYFKHPIMDEMYEYQNGGQWDWFGGRFVLQMFKNNNKQAFLKAKEICKKTMLNNNMYEWDDINGRGRGSARYSGSSAAISRMIIEGIFGIEWTLDKIVLTPRLTMKSGYIYIPNVANDEFLSYEYKNLVSINKHILLIELSFGSNAKAKKEVHLFTKIHDYVISEIIFNGRILNFNINDLKSIVFLDTDTGVLQITYNKP